MTFSHSKHSGVQDKTDPVDIQLGQRIKAFRQRNKQSQMEVAKAVGLSYQHLQKYERGASRMKVSLLMRLSDALNISILAFIPDSGKKAQLDIEPTQLRDMQGRIPHELQPEVVAAVKLWAEGV